MADFTMPSLGADMDAGTLLEWLVRPGDEVHRGQPIAVVDTDKSAIEVESFDDGVVETFLVEPGQRVAVGTPMARIGTGAAVAPARPSTAGPPPAPRAPGAAAAPRSTPYARRLAGELGVDLAGVTGTGADGAVRAEDVLSAAGRAPSVVPAPAAAPAPRATPPAAPPATTATTAPSPRERTSRTTIAALMSRAKREIPHYYVATTVDLDAVTSWLRRRNRDHPVAERVVPAAVLLKATAVALRSFPELNGFWVDDRFVPAEGVHLGVAVTVRHGALVAPAIHDTAGLDVAEVMARLRDLVTRARAGRLTRRELADPTLTVTDLGDQGVEEVIGVIYPPQVGLLGIGRVVERPWAVDGMLTVRPVVRLTLSGDHRATDGYTGARFLAALDALLQHPEDL